MKKVLLDTNIIIHRETERVINRDIGKLFHWLDSLKIEKYIHPITIQEINKLRDKNQKTTFNVKLESYNKLITFGKLDQKVEEISIKNDINENDINDTYILNEVYINAVDLLITEDRKIHKKAKELGISHRVFTIEEFLEKVTTEYPDFTEYKVLSVKISHFGKINLEDEFFDSFKADYQNFDNWFRNKSNELVHISQNENGQIVAFLYFKVESEDENYYDIEPPFQPKKRLKIGTFKTILNGFKLGERFLKIIFDNAIKQKVEEIYVTIFDKRDEQKRLIGLLEEWGFYKYGIKKSTGELVYVRNFSKTYNDDEPKKSFPFTNVRNNRIFIAPIYPDYHTELFPDSILRTESPENFKENKPHRNAISKIYISRSLERDINKNDILIFYRTKEKDKSAYFSAVITTIGIVEEVIDNINNEEEFIVKCKNRSIFNEKGLKEFWNYNPNLRPFIIKFLHVYSLQLGERVNRQRLLELGILTGKEGELRGLTEISKEQFRMIIKEANIDESFIIY